MKPRRDPPHPIDTTMKKPTCVICEGPCGRREENDLFPFCSRRCQLVDLGRWLDGDYRIPSDDDSEQSDDALM